MAIVTIITLFYGQYDDTLITPMNLAIACNISNKITPKHKTKIVINNHYNCGVDIIQNSNVCSKYVYIFDFLQVNNRAAFSSVLHAFLSRPESDLIFVS